jgi:hypothetical protein
LTHRPTALLFPVYDLLMMQLRNKLWTPLSSK